MPAMSLSRVFF